ncbi:MAG: RecX family transcriptional regulator [Balneolaceae bacterium]|nr:RecX family transcriptional regulator [Balneolaceae bacterium]
MPVEPNQQLPARITSISVQKKNKERYSIYVEEGFLVGVSESTLIDLKLVKGVEVTPRLFRKIQREEGRFAVKSYLMKLLARRDHARKELLTKARKKDHPEEVVLDILDELEVKGYINEESFAEKFTADKFNLNQWGPSKIKAHLYKKGVSKHIIEKSIGNYFEDLELKETYKNLVLKRKRRFLKEENPIKRKKKIFDHLNRQGFKPDSIFKHMDELMDMVSE